MYSLGEWPQFSVGADSIEICKPPQYHFFKRSVSGCFFFHTKHQEQREHWKRPRGEVLWGGRRGSSVLTSFDDGENFELVWGGGECGFLFIFLHVCGWCGALPAFDSLASGLWTLFGSREPRYTWACSLLHFWSTKFLLFDLFLHSPLFTFLNFPIEYLYISLKYFWISNLRTHLCLPLSFYCLKSTSRLWGRSWAMESFTTLRRKKIERAFV